MAKIFSIAGKKTVSVPVCGLCAIPYLELCHNYYGEAFSWEYKVKPMALADAEDKAKAVGFGVFNSHDVMVRFYDAESEGAIVLTAGDLNRLKHWEAYVLAENETEFVCDGPDGKEVRLALCYKDGRIQETWVEAEKYPSPTPPDLSD